MSGWPTFLSNYLCDSSRVPLNGLHLSPGVLPFLLAIPIHDHEPSSPLPIFGGYFLS